MTKNKKLDELCYPFIHERGYLCDFEVITDELCSQVGTCLALLDDDHADLAADLALLQPLCWHVNGSIRGRLAIAEGTWTGCISATITTVRKLTACVGVFVLPSGSVLAMQFFTSPRSSARKPFAP